MEDAFRKFWSLKEAYTKGRGDGLGFEFDRCSFRYIGAALESGGAFGLLADRGSVGQPVALASVVVDGKANKSWRFYVQPLQDDHFISVARGSPKEIVDANGAFKGSLSEALPKERLQAEFERPEPPFVSKLVSDLLPDASRMKYLEITMRALKP